MLTLTQEAVVLSREGYLQDEHRKESERETMMRWDDSNLETSHIEKEHQSNGVKKPISTSMPPAKEPEENDWVDDANEDDLPPGIVMAGSQGMPGSIAQGNSVAFPSSSAPRYRAPEISTLTRASNNAESGSAAISNGLRRVEIYEPQIEIPPIAGVILLAGVFDVIKCFRGESDRGVEHLSVLRRSCGPSHTSCLVSFTSSHYHDIHSFTLFTVFSLYNSFTHRHISFTLPRIFSISPCFLPSSYCE